MRRRIVISAVVLLLLAGIVSILWSVLDCPPPRLILKYGFPPAGGPTGNTRVIEGIEFVELKPGYFRMGSNRLGKGSDWLGKLCAPLGLPWGVHADPSDEMPVHWVEFRQGFWIAKTEITNAQYEQFKPNHERSQLSPGDDDPVLNVSCREAQFFCAWFGLRLPSEAEWEWACRSGSDDEYCYGGNELTLAEYAWFDRNSGGRAHEVATRRANRWGLYDMHGNVWEWCEDKYHDSYQGAPTDGSPWVDKERNDHVIRGGCWHSEAFSCRSAMRGIPLFGDWMGNSATFSREPIPDRVGFRPVFTLPEAK